MVTNIEQKLKEVSDGITMASQRLEMLRRKESLLRSQHDARIAAARKRHSGLSSASELQALARIEVRLKSCREDQAHLVSFIAAQDSKRQRYEDQLASQRQLEMDALRRSLVYETSRLSRDLAVQTKLAAQALQKSGANTSRCRVFISYASEDKEPFVRSLATGLQDGGVDVWYDEFQLRIGDSLRRSIDRGLVRSDFGIVVLSSAFFSKNWTQYELDALVSKENSAGTKVILPIWHKVSKDEVAAYSATLADRVALNTGMHGLGEIVNRLLDVVRGTQNDSLSS